MTRVLAIDLGASSGRAIIGEYRDKTIHIKEISRFDNYVKEKGKGLFWDLNKIMNEIYKSIQIAEKQGGFESVAIDTWGVDIGLLDSSGNLIRDPVHYRDSRVKGTLDIVREKVSLDYLYEETGIQIMEINTLFQLLQLKINEPDIYKQTEKFLLIPDLINYLLTGKKHAEKSIASTTQLFNPEQMSWSKNVIDTFKLKESLFPSIISAGTVLGKIKPEIQRKLSIGSKKVITIASHDTASAVLSIPTLDDNPLFLSSGTWSLLGKELQKPILDKTAGEYNLANEVGAGDKITFLSNITGLWVIQECQRYYMSEGMHFSYSEIAEKAEKARNVNCFINVSDERFSSPGNMPLIIQEYAEKSGQKIPQTPSEVFRVIYESLAMKYREVLENILDCTESKSNELYIVGGGSNVKMLCQMTANVTGKKVIAGPSEATAVGNILMQLIGLNRINNIQEGRQLINGMKDITEYFPKEESVWFLKYKKYKKMMK